MCGIWERRGTDNPSSFFCIKNTDYSEEIITLKGEIYMLRLWIGKRKLKKLKINILKRVNRDIIDFTNDLRYKNMSEHDKKITLDKIESLVQYSKNILEDM